MRIEHQHTLLIMTQAMIKTKKHAIDTLKCENKQAKIKNESKTEMKRIIEQDP